MLSTKFHVVVTFVVCLSHYIISTKCGQTPQCKGVDMSMTEEATMNINECLDEAKVTTYKDVPEEQKSCLGKCILMKRKLIDEAGMVNKDNLMNFVQSSIPTEVVGELVGRMGTCFDDNGSNLQTGTTDNCDSFQPLLMCLHTSFTEVCKA